MARDPFIDPITYPLDTRFSNQLIPDYTKVYTGKDHRREIERPCKIHDNKKDFD